jgi:hypothetical protein
VESKKTKKRTAIWKSIYIFSKQAWVKDRKLRIWSYSSSWQAWIIYKWRLYCLQFRSLLWSTRCVFHCCNRKVFACEAAWRDYPLSTLQRRHSKVRNGSRWCKFLRRLIAVPSVANS